MRTNIVIDNDLITEAMTVSGATTKREAVERALKQMVQLARQSEIRNYFGKLHWEGDLDAMRRDG